MAGTQRDIQQLIQSLVPSGVNNGNPNTVYNTAGTPYGGTQQVPLPPMQDAQGNWFMNSVSNAANLGPANLQAMPAPMLGQPWQPAYSTQARLPVWPTPFDPAQYGTPASGTGVPPTTPVLPPDPLTPEVPGGVGTIPPYGNGRGGGCVVVDSILEDFTRAGDVEVGDEMIVSDPVTFKQSKGKVSYSETKRVPCVRITTESGIELECSRTAPIADERGEQVLAPDLMHKLIPVCNNGMYYLDRVTEIEDIGEQEVQHITVENNFFLAGKEKGRYVFHHNMKMVEGTEMDIRGMMDSLNSQFGWSTNTGGMGAESMGNHSMFGSTGYRNDNMSAGQYTSGGNGWFENSAASGYTPTGQGIIDAFGEMADPTMGDSMTNNPWGALNSDPYNSTWFQDNQMYLDNTKYTGAGGNAPPSGGGDFFDKIDNAVLGDVWNSEKGSMNWGNLLAGIGELATGIPINAGRMAMGTANLMNEGKGTSADYARNQLRNTYNSSNQEQRTQLVSTLAEKYKMTEAQVKERLGVGQ